MSITLMRRWSLGRTFMVTVRGWRRIVTIAGKRRPLTAWRRWRHVLAVATGLPENRVFTQDDGQAVAVCYDRYQLRLCLGLGNHDSVGVDGNGQVTPALQAAARNCKACRHQRNDK